MKLLLRAAYIQKDLIKAKIVNYDKSSKRRPAWIRIKVGDKKRAGYLKTNENFIRKEIEKEGWKNDKKKS